MYILELCFECYRDTSLGEAERAIVNYLDMLRYQGQILGREALFRSLRGRDYDGQDRSMDVAISRLRRRLGDDSNNPTRIKTVRQKGYLLVPQAWE